MDHIRIDTKRFFVRTLLLNEDLESYLRWMQNVVENKYILSVRSDYSIEELKSFIDNDNLSTSCILLGIFDKNHGHIGNIRFSKIDPAKKSAEVGFLIGEFKFRGIGVAEEVFLATVMWLKNAFQIRTVYLGVNYNNTPALNLYEKLGFVKIAAQTPLDDIQKMKFEL
jgi:RimJ/RimL family protein N-acetyltransferase